MGTCRRPGCDCPHTGPCDAGFINLTDDRGRDTGVKPCPRCAPALAEIIATSPTGDERQTRLAAYAQERSHRTGRQPAAHPAAAAS